MRGDEKEKFLRNYGVHAMQHDSGRKDKHTAALWALLGIFFFASFVLFYSHVGITGFSILNTNNAVTFSIQQNWDMNNAFARISQNETVYDVHNISAYVQGNTVVLGLNSFALQSGEVYVDLIVNDVLVDSQHVSYGESGDIAYVAPSPSNVPSSSTPLGITSSTVADDPSAGKVLIGSGGPQGGVEIKRDVTGTGSFVVENSPETSGDVQDSASAGDGSSTLGIISLYILLLGIGLFFGYKAFGSWKVYKQKKQAVLSTTESHAVEDVNALKYSIYKNAESFDLQGKLQSEGWQEEQYSRLISPVKALGKGKLEKYVYARLGNHDDAERIVQDLTRVGWDAQKVRSAIEQFEQI
ncbi:hypothetical protein HZA98_03385 [Candidatus Woesearchaeota archaeon]|nr:hypothetical protein [Candidatus Woesearchaeota archaeon]